MTKRARGEEIAEALGYRATPDGSIYKPKKGNKEDYVRVKTHITETGYEHFSVRAGFTYSVGVHRFIYWSLVNPIPKGLVIDHINRERSDNRLENLRMVTVSENNRNRDKYTFRKVWSRPL